MSSYVIDYSDPLRGSFSIPPNGFDGPGGAASNTSLRLFGRGSLEWGEAVDENLVRLSENFAGATAPVAPVAGQLWLRQKLYWYNTTGGALSTGAVPTGRLWRYSFSNNAWYDATPGPNAFTVTAYTTYTNLPVSGTVGQYVWTIDTSKLYRWDSAYKQGTPTWLERTNSATAGNPSAAKPEQSLLVYDQFSVEWTSPSTVVYTSPLHPQVGQFRLDQTTGTLYMWSGAAWQQILGPGTTGFSVPSPVNPGDAVNLSFANTTYLNVSGDTMTGNLTLANSTPSLSLHAASKGYVDNNFINKDGSVSMTGALTLLNSTPTLPLHATSKGYVDTAVSAISGSSVIPTIYGALGAAKNGDIAVIGSTIYMYASGWKQVFPAVYS